MERIVSAQNERIRKLTKLHQKKDRDASGLFLVEGEHLIQEALKAGIVREIFYDEDCPFPFVPATCVSAPVLAKLSGNVSAAHWIAVCAQPDLTCEQPQRVLMLDGVQDPGNLGTLIRTAVSFGFDEVLCSAGCADFYNDKTVRSTQGALFHLPVRRLDLAAAAGQLQAEGFLIVATSLQESRTMREIPASAKIALVLGNEGQGVSKEMLAAADACVRIEMRGFESLNVAVAGGILMYHFRQS